MDLLYKCFSRFVLQVVWINAGREEVPVEKWDFKCIACRVLIELLIQYQALRIVGTYVCYLCMETVPAVLSGCGVFLLEW